MKSEVGFAGNLIKIIENSRNNALRRVNEELIQMYWKVGEYLSKESKNTAFGDVILILLRRKFKCISWNKRLYQARLI